MNDPDGTRRTVDYTADPVNGFNAVVRKTPLVQTAVPVVATHVVAPVLSAVPVAVSHAEIEKLDSEGSHAESTNSIEPVKEDKHLVPVLVTKPAHSSVVETSSSVVHGGPVALTHYTTPYGKIILIVKKGDSRSMVG